MVGLGDIPCVGKFVERVSEYSVDAVFRGFRYMFCYKALVDQLKSETEKLNIEKAEMSSKVTEEKANGKEILGHVSKWQNDVEEIQKNAEDLSPSCSCIQCLSIPDPVSRFRIGRNAAKKAEAVTKLTISGKGYLGREIAQLPPVLNMPKPDTAFEEFQSRKDVYKKLWDALVNEDGPLICGIHGMAGVGKTRMMEKLWEDAMEKKIFGKVVRVNVGSEKLNEIKLQDQIADRLDCKLGSQDMERRASQLENSLKNGGKILLILDDVWGEIRLDKIIGTSFGDNSSSKGSKILLTSREKEVCLRNKCEHPVKIKTLSPGEALDLFKKAVGPGTINSLLDESLVKKVCDKCGQLPLVIHAVGKALKDKSHNLWTYAHNQLMKGKFEKIDGVDPQVYTGIKLSIDYLPNDEAKYCLFLCSMFPEDANIDVKLLNQLATGSRLIPGGELSILAKVVSLKASSLLLDSGKEYEIKVHDIIRDVARSMASTDSKCAFLHVKCNSKYFPSDDSDCTGKFLRLDAETDDVHFEEGKVCRDLHTLWLQCNNHPQQFSGGFFSMFANLSCLMLQNVNISLEQFSLQPLDNLRTLSLLKCDIRKTDDSLFPKKLKTLCICVCELPLPLNVANLKYLRKLEIWSPKLVMVSNVISSLSSLEELHIPNGFDIDRVEVQREPIEMEISKLTHLTSLRFHFYDDDTFQGTNIFSNIDRYDIVVGEGGNFLSRDFEGWVPLTRSIEFDGNPRQSWEGLMARAEQVRLANSDFEVSSICNGHTRAFEDLKRLYIKKCDKMGHLASKSQDEIQSSPQRTTCFSQLTILEISSCSKLKYLFCINIAKSLGQLQELSVERCESMEAIIMNEGASDGEIINFPKLKSLKIRWNRLTSFYAEKENMHSGSTSPVDNSAQYHPLFDGKVAFPSLEKLDIWYLDTASVIWGKDCFIDSTVSSFCKLNYLEVFCCHELEILIPMLPRVNNLEYIHVYECSRLRSMFPPSVASDLKHLKEMKVGECGKMREIIEAGEQVITDDGILFPQLTLLDLYDLPSLTSFWCYQSGKASTCKVPLTLPQLSAVALVNLPDLKSFFHGANFEFHMPALKYVEVDSCGLLTLFTLSVLRKLPLEKLEVRDCELLENIVEDLRGDETCDKIITLSQLTIVDLAKLPNLKSFFHNANYEFHMPALKQVIVDSCGLKYLFRIKIAKSLGQLQELSVKYCESMEAIIMNEGTSDGEIINFPKLKSLTIWNRLTSFYAEKENMHSGSTSPVDNSAQYHPLFDGKVAFPSLERLDITGLDTTSVIWGKDCFIDCTVSSFCKLNYLRVFRCHELEILIPMLPRVNNLEYIHVYKCSRLRSMFPPSVASDLKHLKEMKVGECGKMREIIEAGEQVITDDGILFPQLTFLSLYDLPSLTSFWCYQSGKASTCKVPLTLPQLSAVALVNLPDLKSFFHGANFEFHMPALNRVTVCRCGLLTLFTLSVFRKLPLEKLEVRDCELLENIVEDLRGDETCDKIITLSQLTKVDLAELPNLKSFFHNANYEFHMPALKEVTVDSCGLSNTLFTRSVFKNLKQLQELSVCDCELLEGIFEDARCDETLDTSDKTITLNRVSKVRLRGLPRFKSIFYGATYECHMPALRDVTIAGCGLSILFTCSVFQEIRQLERLHVSDCESLKRIVEEVESVETSETNGKSITSSQLSSITLESLPNLKSFGCTSSYVFKMPKLKNFRLIKCPQIEYFSSSKTNTSLVHVTSDWCSEEGIQDLNDFIRQNHQRGSYLSEHAGESSYSSHDLGTQSERIEEEKSQKTETDQSDSSV